MHSLRSKWFAVLLAYIFMFAAYGHSPAAELPQTGALAPAEALQLMDTLGDKLTVIRCPYRAGIRPRPRPRRSAPSDPDTARTYGSSPRRRLPSCSSAGPDAGLKRPTT